MHPIFIILIAGFIIIFIVPLIAVIGQVVIEYWYWFTLTLALGLLIQQAYYHLIYLPWLKKLQKAPTLYLFNYYQYIIPIDWKKEQADKTWKVKYIRPILTDEQVSFREATIEINQVEPLRSEQKEELKAIAMLQMAAPTQEIFQKLQPQIQDLNNELKELNRLKNLAASSQVYQQQAELYERGLKQLNQLLKSSEVLYQQNLDFIREILIGLELANFKTENWPDPIEHQLSFQTQYSTIQTQLENLKLEVDAYQSLRRDTANY